MRADGDRKVVCCLSRMRPSFLRDRARSWEEECADCLFCKIVAKELESEVVQETETVVAFKDINPGGPTHVLVIPKEHIASAARPDRRPTATSSARCSASWPRWPTRRRACGTAFRVVTNVGPDAGQSVHHLHFHVLGGRPMAWPPG